MSSTTVAEFANELKKPADVLLDQLRSAGVAKTSDSDTLNDTDKQKLLSYLQASHGTVTGDRKKSRWSKSPPARSSKPMLRAEPARSRWKCARSAP